MQIQIANIPHPAQQSVLDSSARFRVLMCGRRFGKSLIAQIIALMKCGEGKKVAYITPTYLLAGVFFDALAKELPPTIYRNGSDKLIEFNGGQIRFFTGEKLDRLRGQSFHTAIIDEASFIPNLESGWQNSIRPTLTDYSGNALFLSTPRGKNYFYSLFMKGDGSDPDWQSFKYSSYDNPHISGMEIDAARDQLPADVFRQEYLADPMDNAANPFGGTYIRQCIYPISTAPPVCFGVDLAKSVDWTVIVGIDANGGVCHYERFQRDWRQTKQAISALPRVPTLIDSTGVGDPIFEDLARDGRPVEGYKFSSQSKQQLMDGLVTAIQQRIITFPEGQITRELEVFEYQYTPTGVKYCVSLDTMILKSDLTWAKAEDISVNDELVGFDEFFIDPNKKRMYRKSKVLQVETIVKPCYKIYLENGDELVSSDDHLWLVDTNNLVKEGGKLAWIKTEKLRGENKTASNRYMPHKIVKPFEMVLPSNTYEAGYLAGVFDGEGYLQNSERNDHPGYNLRLGFSQKENELFDHAIKYLDGFGIKYKAHKNKTGTYNDVRTVNIIGRRKEVFKALMKICPKRLMKNVDPDKFGTFEATDAVRVKKVEFIGDQKVMAISTSTKTFVANGYASHNCAPTGFTDDCVMALGLAWHKFQRSRTTGKYTFV